MNKPRFRLPRLPSYVTWILSIVLIGVTSAGVIAYGKGYRLNYTQTQEKDIVRSTGLLSANSDPVGAQVYIDGSLTTATNNSVNISPGAHTIRITKDGYLPWQKEFIIDKEVVSQADAFLFPINPSLSPLTSTGVLHPALSEDGTRIAYVVPPKENPEPTDKTAGVWIYDLVDRPLGFNRDPRRIIPWTDSLNLLETTIMWSPNSDEILLEAGDVTRLFTIDRANSLQVVTETKEDIREEWNMIRKEKQEKQLAAFPIEIIQMSTESARIIAFSPDETKLLYEATQAATLAQIIDPPIIGANSTKETRIIEPGKLYIYDKKEDKNFFLFDKKEVLPTPSPSPTTPARRVPTPTPTPEDETLGNHFPIHWFPTNRHIVAMIPGKIDILEYDRTNWVTVYAGPFVESFVAPWPGGSRIIIVTNLNPGSAPYPNLYTVNLR